MPKAKASKVVISDCSIYFNEGRVDIFSPIFFLILSFISKAALLVKVNINNSLTSHFLFFTNSRTRSLKTAVLPLPAPAATRQFPLSKLMALSWSGVNGIIRPPHQFRYYPD